MKRHRLKTEQSATITGIVIGLSLHFEVTLEGFDEFEAEGDFVLSENAAVEEI